MTWAAPVTRPSHAASYFIPRLVIPSAATTTRTYLPQWRRSFGSSVPISLDSAASSSSSSSVTSEASTGSFNTAQSAAAAEKSTVKSPLSVSLLLSRQPIVLREPHPFELAYYDYNRRLQHATAQPFPKELYFKKGSSAERRWEDEERERLSALHAGNNDAARTAGSQPNGIVGEISQGQQQQQQQKDSQTEMLSPQELLKQQQSQAQQEQDAELYATQPRRTAADEGQVVTSLERALDRTLFLVVRERTSAPWRLPRRSITRTTDVPEGSKSDALHKAATSAAYSLLGPDMDIWLVTNLPVGVMPVLSTESNGEPAEKTYILRGHILAGEPSLAGAPNGLEFAWLTREELRAKLLDGPNASNADAQYWAGIEELLTE